MKMGELIQMVKDRMRREEIYSSAAFWDWKAEKYAGDAVSMWANNHLNVFYHEEQIAWIQKHLADVNGAKVLDVGCGTGRFSRYFSERGANVLGIDFSSKSIDIARRQSSGPNPCYRVQSIFDLDEQNAFDIAVSWGTLGIACKNETELLDVLVRLRNALKPDGRAVLLEPVNKGFMYTLLGGSVLNMNIKEFAAAMGKAGFKIEEITNLHFWPVRMALGYHAWPKGITTFGYRLGQRIMNLFGNKALGDYKAIYATVASSV